MSAATPCAPRPPARRRDWLAKTLAGIVPGLGLALGVSALFDLAAASLPIGVRAQLAMWLVPPVWFGTLGLCFLFGSGLRAWLWLGAANMAVFSLWGALRLL
ncbi:hypothetical protein ABIC63_005774 [Pseudacidovorax sp. 1753]|uniref:hypothetical protein n=1 Tax=Pseudacidovorax sp. 1753 TaxID=3156419 RepID=UPI001B16CDBF|nr:hypothetical protein [Pseudacidovorax sp.]